MALVALETVPIKVLMVQIASLAQSPQRVVVAVVVIQPRLVALAVQAVAVATLELAVLVIRQVLLLAKVIMEAAAGR